MELAVSAFLADLCLRSDVCSTHEQEGLDLAAAPDGLRENWLLLDDEEKKLAALLMV